MIRSAARRSVIVLAATALLATACVPQTNLPSDCGRAEVQRAVTLANETFTPQRIDVCKGQTVTVTVTPQQDGELHFHGYDDAVPETAVHAGEDWTFTFTAVHVGQFPIELHPPTGDAEVQVGILTVYEP